MTQLEIETQHYFDDVNDFFNFFTPWNNSELKDYIFRGHSNSFYKLIPSVLRPEVEEKLWNTTPFYVDGPAVTDSLRQILLEKNLLRDFYRKANSHGLFVPISPKVRKGLSNDFDSFFYSNNEEGIWINSELLEVAALCQHYGLPTRLIDWTFDPFIAIFFALRSALYKKTDGMITIWCLNKNFFNQSIFLSNPIINFYIPHYNQNSNITAQKGLFSYRVVKDIKNINNIDNEAEKLSDLTTDRSPLNEYIKQVINNIPVKELTKLDNFKNIHKVFISVTFPYSMVFDAFKTLNNFGYTSGKIFPGYDGIVKEMFDVFYKNRK